MKPVVILGQECRVTASIGICMHPDDGQDDQAIMKNADMAMYLAKEEGKNNFQFFTSGMKPQSIERLALETHLRRALERNELSLHYQAKVNFKSGAITGVEALLRWHNPELGSVSPARFIPLAEETGLIVPIGKWVLRTACAQSVAWQKQGLPPVCMSVNLSLRQLNDEELVRRDRAPCSPRPGMRARAARARDHREHDHAQRRARRARADAPSRISACGSRSTTSAPAIRRWRT